MPVLRGYQNQSEMRLRNLGRRKDEMNTNAQALSLLQQAFDALEATADSDIDMFEDEEEEAEAVPAQYACRKIMEAMDLIRAENLKALTR